MRRYPSDVAFTPAVKAIQVEKGSRAAYARMEWGSGWQTAVTPELEAFLAGLDMFYLGTANAQGQPVHPVPGRPARLPQGRWTTGRSPSPTSAATASTSRWATSRRTRRRSSS